MYAVVGSTGKVGSAVVRALVAGGAKVRGLIRDEAKAEQVAAMGAEPFLASVEDGGRLQMGFEDTEGVFVMTPPFLKAHDPRTENELAIAALAHALQAAHVPKAVLLSSIGAQHAKGTGAILKAHDAEEALMPLSVSITAIRAAYFMENLMPLLPHVKESGKLPVMLEPLDRPYPMIATVDIGELAARLLTERWDGKRIVELEGPRQYSMRDAAQAMGKVLGREVTAELVPADARQSMFERFGMTPGFSETMVEMTDGWNSGLVAFEGGGAAEHAQGATTLEQVLGG